MSGRSRERFRGDSLHWIIEGVAASACTLWWGMSHARAIAVALGLTQSGAPVFATDYEFHRVLVVWGLTIAMAVAVFAGFWLMRGRTIDGRSTASWIFFLLGWGILAAALLTARDVRGRPVTADIWIVLAGSGWGFGVWFMRRRRGTAVERPGSPG